MTTDEVEPGESVQTFRLEHVPLTFLAVAPLLGPFMVRSLFRRGDFVLSVLSIPAAVISQVVAIEQLQAGTFGTNLAMWIGAAAVNSFIGFVAVGPVFRLGRIDWAAFLQGRGTVALLMSALFGLLFGVIAFVVALGIGNPPASTPFMELLELSLPRQMIAIPIGVGLGVGCGLLFVRLILGKNRRVD